MISIHRKSDIFFEFFFTAYIIYLLAAIKNGGLPTFSPLVEKHLQEKIIELVWNKFIAETATYFF